MELFETKLGKWIQETSGELHGEGTRAYAVAGEETDVNYTAQATLRLVKGTKASIIGFHISLPTEKYVEFVLDSVTNKVLLDKIEGITRTNIKEQAYTIKVNTDYTCELSITINLIMCKINGAIVIKQAPPTGYTAGRYGFGHDGTLTTDYSIFNKIYVQKANHYTTVSTLISCIRSVDPKELVGKDGTVQDYFDYLTTLIEQSSRFIDGETQRETNFFEEGGLSLIEYFSGIGSPTPTGLYEFTEQAEAWQTKAASLFLTQRPVLSITKIEENSAEIGDVDVWTEITKYRWFTHGEIVFASGSIPAKGTKNVRVTYKGGYNKTPIDIQMACTRLIVNMIHKTISDRTAAFVSFARPTAVNFSMPEVLTPDIRGVLLRYRLLGFGEF